MKRGQAAMEFLMTYGWALLIVLVAIAVLAAMGVFRMGKTGNEFCNMGPGLSCKDFKIQKVGGVQDGIIVMGVVNGMGKNFKHFYITFDPKPPAGQGRVCEGMFGLIAIPIPVLGLDFPDGSVRDLRNLVSVGSPPTLGMGIECNNRGDHLSCCGNANAYLLFLGTGVRVPCHVAGGATQCDPTLLPEPGNRFKANFFITYQFDDSALVHSRQGTLVGQVEGP